MTTENPMLIAKALLVLVMDKAKREGVYDKEFDNLDDYILVKRSPTPAATEAGQKGNGNCTNIPSSL